MILRKFRLISSVLLILGLTFVVTVSAVVAGPLFDPFVEKFQVGTWSDPAKVDLAHGYPAGLLEPARLDTAWTEAATAVFGGDRSALSGHLTHKFLHHLWPAGADTVWLSSARTALADLVAGQAGDLTEPFLLPERLTMAFGQAVAAGDQITAAEIAALMLAEADVLGLHNRDRLIWDLRLRLTRLLARDPLPVDDKLWPAVAELGSFDTSNAWVLWVAQRRELGRPVLTAAGDQEQLAGVVGRLRKGWFTPAELYGSSLPDEWQAGLGGILLASKDLPAHFKKFPQPPANYSRQGQWVRGQRRRNHGKAGSYELLAARKDLKPGWRMDVWRRASELRLLKGAWVEGLADLTEALQYARAGNGTKGQRRRLRQWTEQALVLALAHNDSATARRVRDLGLDHFQGEQYEAFTREIRYWTDSLDPSQDPAIPLSSDHVDVARLRVKTGSAANFKPITASERSKFLIAADQKLWETWYKWGLVLANPARVSGEVRKRAFTYREALLEGLESENPTALADAALGIIALRFQDREFLSELLRKAVDVDAGALCGWQTPPRPSPVPDLLPAVRGSELDRHALLGFCLATGDMRGILGLAYELPGRGLTRDEKRLFLYPLPAVGPIRDEIHAAENEPSILLAVARNESLFEPAVRSRAGALGWMQIMPFHYPQHGAVFGSGNWRIPAMSIQRGDGLLTENRRRYKGDPYRILAAYNAGPGAAARWDKQLAGAASRDIYLAWIGYTETRAYVEKVLIDREIYHAIFEAKLLASTPKE